MTATPKSALVPDMKPFSIGNDMASWSKYIVLGAGTLGVAISLYVMRSRRKGTIYITKEKFVSHQDSSGTSLVSSSDENDERVHEHPEGPNIGFGSDPSWYRGANRDKTDLLHTGSVRGGKLVVVMVGLPGSGKTFISRKVSRYLRWISYRTRVFSLAKYRLEKIGAMTADFFDNGNEENKRTRVELMLSAVEDAMRYLQRDGDIAIIDGANTSMVRRDLIRERVAKEDDFKILWIENIVDPEVILSRNTASIHTSPDFTNDEDFIQRIKFYKDSYESVEDSEGMYIKLIDSGDKIELHSLQGFLPTKIASFVMNVHTIPRTVYMVRAGESEFISKGLIGGDSGLTANGMEFARALSTFMQLDDTGFAAPAQQSGLSVWTSTMRSAVETSKKIQARKYVEFRSLREIEAGVCDGLTYDQIKVNFPLEYRARQNDKLRYRYPRGESYFDVITRLEPLIFEVERQKEPLLIVSHLAVLRCLYAYFLDLPMEEVPFLNIGMNTLIRLEPKAYGCKEKRVRVANRRDDTSESDPVEQDV